MAMIPETVIAEIRDRVDLVELIGSYLNLKRSGRNHQGLCPFHQEKTPSFNVSPDRQIYHCFGCGVTGDAFRFLMEHDHLSFPEAVRTLAARVGVDLSKYETGPGRSPDELDELYRALGVAVRLYRQTLDSDEGRLARAELERRRLSGEIVREYRLGAAPEAWDRLLGAARREGIRPQALERAGLAVARESGTGWYDRFRGRLMFPIETIGSKVIGFGGRILGEGEPKYLNTPETALFRKRQTLYGFPQARDALREERAALLVEGYTDVLALAQAGFRNVLAALGTAFTEDHARSLARSVERVTVVFDGDEAGLKAARASAGPLLGAGLDVKMVLLPAGQDPDSLLRGEGAEAFARRLERALPALDVVLGEEVYEGGAPRERAVRRALEALAHVTDPLRRRVHVEELSARTGLPGDVLEEQLRSPRSREVARVPPGRRASAAVPEETKRLPPLERVFVAVLLREPDVGETLLERFAADEFDHPVAARIVAKAAELTAAGRLGAEELLSAFADDVNAYRLLGELSVSDEFAVELTRQAEDCRMAMERRAMEREMEYVMQEMRKAKARGDAAGVREFVRRRGELARGLAALKAPKQTMEDA